MPHVLGNAGGPAPPTRTELLLQAENERLREVVNRISVLLDTSPIGPTRADLALLAFQIRQVIDAFREASTDG